MNIRTIEHDFEYQANQIFESLAGDYKLEQMENIRRGDTTISFSNWLWDNSEELGQAFFTQIDEWCGIDELTEKYNVKS